MDAELRKLLEGCVTVWGMGYSVTANSIYARKIAEYLKQQMGETQVIENIESMIVDMGGEG